MDNFVTLLSAFEQPNVFNPWRHRDILDAALEPEHFRLDRLLSHFQCDPVMLLIGEAPGYQGCHFSGVPFTNERLILEGRIPRVYATGRLTTRQLSFCEPSASIVWGSLHELGVADRTVMWNAFAWHPHKPNEPYSNRAPSQQELQAGLPILKLVLDRFAHVPVVPVGRVAEKILAKLGIKARPSLRHPSMGGAEKFRAGLRELVKGL